MTCLCTLPRLRWIGRKFLCPRCNTCWTCERYIKWRVWTAPRTHGKVVRRV